MNNYFEKEITWDEKEKTFTVRYKIYVNGEWKKTYYKHIDLNRKIKTFHSMLYIYDNKGWEIPITNVYIWGNKYNKIEKAIKR